MTVITGDRRKNDWNKLARGLPSTGGIQDPEVRAICDAISQTLDYLIKKVQDIRVPDETKPRTDVTNRPPVYTP
jgi:hypothetical protein